MRASTKKVLSLLIVLCLLAAYIQPAVFTVLAVGTPVCEINSIGYGTFADALAAVSTDETIRLLSNINYNSSVSINDMNITFDLNGYTLNVINPNDTGAYLDQCGLYVSGVSAVNITGTGEFNVQGNRYGVYATCLTAGDTNVTVTNASSPAGTGVYSDKATVTVKNDINSGYEGAFANTESNITIEGDVIVHGDSSSGLNMIFSSTFTVYGDISVTGDYMEGIRGNDSCSVTVHGNVDCTGIGTVGVSSNNTIVVVNGNVRAHMTGIKARSGSNITVNGDITSYGTSDDGLLGGIRNAVYAYAGSTVTVHGNLYSENIGVYITDEWGARISSTVTVNGFIQAAARANSSYVYFATDDIGMIFEDGLLDDPVMIGYRKYNNASGVVYVSKFGGGTGTTADPYIINHSHQLYNVRENLADNFQLGNDIDMTYFVPDNGWMPIGRQARQFSGIFDGNNKIISNLKMQRETLAVTPRYLGLFAYTSTTAQIKDMSLTNVNIRGWDNIGSVVGYNNGHVLNVNASVTLNCTDDLGGLVGYNKGTIENSYATGTLTNGTFYAGGIAGHNDGIIRNSYFRGTVNGDEYNGGLVGYNRGSVYDSYAEITVNGYWRTAGLVGYNMGLVKDSYSTGSVISDGDYVGGLAGVNTNFTTGPVYLGVIDSCYSTCSVQGDYYIGGLVGYNDAEIKLSYATGNVSGEYDIGGLVGAHYDSTYALLENSYARGNASGRGSVGGLTGLNEKTVQNCYSTGTVTKVGSYGGLIGDDLSSSGVTNASYWDTQTSNASTSHGGEGKTTVLIKTASTFSSWDFSTIWGINGTDNDGYPYLRWQGFSLVLPVVSAVSLNNITRNDVTLNFNSDTAGTYYYVIYSATDSTPNAAIVKAQGAAISKGTDNALAASNTTSVTGLTAGTAYKAYVVVENAAGTLSNVSEASFSTLPSNTIPNRKVSVTGTYSETVTVNNPFSLNLNDIFEDADLDPLTYTVSIAGAAKIAAASNYTYTPAIAGDTVLVFKANDGTAESTDTYTVTVTAADVPPLPLVPLYQFNISVGPGGSITAGFNNTISEGTRLGISATPNSGYVFLRWVSTGRGEFIDSSNPSTTFIMPSEDVIVTAEFIYIGDLDEGLDSGYSASIRGALETMCPVIIDSSVFMANIETSDDVFNNDDNTVIDVSEIPNVLSYSLSLPAQNLSNRTNGKKVLFNSPIAKIELPDNMLSNLQDTHGQKAVITIKKAGKNDLSDKMAKIAGVRPIIQLTLMLDGQEIKWENPEVPVQVAIPYVPTEQELLNPDAITVWAQNDSGEAECVINGRYDPLTGTVTFKTRYFQYFTIGYDEKDINGINDGMWYGKAMKFAAIHDIIKKTDDTYSPYEELSRQQLVVIMLKAYNIPLNDDISDNFTDAVNTDTIRFLAKARKLGISKGIGDNMFNPDGKVSRQEMITMLYRMLMILNELPPMANARQLTDFYDYESIAPWAKEAFEVLIQAGAINGSNGNLYPTSIATKAEFVQIIYNLMKK